MKLFIFFAKIDSQTKILLIFLPGSSCFLLCYHFHSNIFFRQLTFYLTLYNPDDGRIGYRAAWFLLKHLPK
jgi:hypothetical protein